MGSPLRLAPAWVISILAITLLLGTACQGFPLRPTTPTPTPTAPVPTPTPTPLTIRGALPAIADVVEKVTPAVVSVLAHTQSGGRVLPQGVATGTGFIFDRRGYILTNNHVVENAQRVDVTLSDGRTLPARIVGADRLTDLAVLQIDIQDPPTVPLGDSSRLRVGDWVVAIGNALGLPGGPTVTVGVVSALGRSFQVSADLRLYDLVQTDASINPGNSGGPLVNLDGLVVGINTAIFRGELPQGGTAEGIGFAVGSDTAVPVADQLIRNGRVAWPWLGVNVNDVTPVLAAQQNLPVNRGVLVVSVVSGSPAQKAGVQPRDVIVALGGNPVDEVRHLQRVLRKGHAVGDTVAVTVAREDQRLDIPVTLEEMPR